MFQHEALAKGRYKRVPSRWETEFGRWAGDFGVPQIVKALTRDPDLRVTNQAVYEWPQGHPARPRFSQPITPELRVGRLRFGRTKTGKRRAGVTRTRTYLVPDVGTFQRVGKEASRMVYFFSRGKRLKPRLRFFETARKEARRRFREEMQREVVNAIARAHGKGL